MNDRSLLLRNSFVGAGKFGIPSMHRQETDLKGLRFLGFQNTKLEEVKNKHCTIHFFKWDNRFHLVYIYPDKYIKRLSQYKQLCTPDFSLFTAMPLWLQTENVAHSRWCGVFWQRNGFTVIPTITWGDENSFEFCFDGIPQGCTLAVSTNGNKRTGKEAWLKGFRQMCTVLEPDTVICYGKPFPECANHAKTRYVPDEGNEYRRRLRLNPPGQRDLFGDMAKGAS